MHALPHVCMRVRAMHACCVNMPRRQYLNILCVCVCVMLIRVMMMLPAKTPTRHINSCCSKLSCLITAIKLSVCCACELQCMCVSVCIAQQALCLLPVQYVCILI